MMILFLFEDINTLNINTYQVKNIVFYWEFFLKYNFQIKHVKTNLIE
jgi:hypothetical protein